MSSTTAPDAESPIDQLNLVEAVCDGLYTEMSQNEDVVVLGEDVGKNGGVFRATDGLYEVFGDGRVIDTPLAEAGIVGSAIGLALSGLRPVAEMQFMGFIYPAFDQLVSHAARLRSRSHGQYTVPMVVRAPYGGGIHAPEHHSESKEAFFAHEPGLKVVCPSTPYDAKGLLIASLRDPDPVIFLEPKLIYRAFKEAVPTGSYEVPLSDASVRREGSDISVYTWGAMTRPTLIAADNLADEHGVDAEVVDLRTLSPLDTETIVESFKKTGRAAVVHEAPKTAGLGAEVSSTIQEEALLYQEAPIKRITGFDAPVPLHGVEDYYLPQAVRIQEGILETVGF
ncbi:alpha-ketoacid dehydrogenase subunit beta (plasmid) [Haloferax mediterranei ATCC 33500]|uniref:2-oxoisovalerate dehydrogenase n=1 Tax=Haloferax mediterranei (strain ATCC 33500 / DSM 1411 / JCM 8866 / NBRC 14739 / NCIMB 2177 / R-4) TaxID=523841 RepID=I3RAA4_HALMT|nr:alpha-ketoacid dehydrogenase subunit beta [Haloferax mediterranei]AFK21164.1 Pyruvate dehydrogenase E1 component subunit beta [Haloferax mediterranei ATCC 33500]AHZ24717.1 2-oxoisovalerate dehydrogenase [Haloferax mediterranei ATCC 33500]ELZ97500.1 Pyruvate dehydrogenase E1 component subunit beta [Haloferax mediterranei ATCC 33500]MDX5990208.1 alpha-ketoacid dehydrogenase subunit beta [Haloferax mediterranei ATCC 33500]QCQ76723.1 alpha-ketoacid dehydrogenase subunit beta [Haloferax mediterr